MKRDRREELLNIIKQRTQKNYIVQYERESCLREDGTALVEVCISEDMELFNPLSGEARSQLTEDVFDYVEQCVNVIRAEIPVAVRFSGKAFSKVEQEQIRKLWERHYTDVLLDHNWDQRINRAKILGLSIFGVCMLALYFAVSALGTLEMLPEVLSIIGSFSLWEATDCFILERTSLRIDQMNTAQLLTARIEFD